MTEITQADHKAAFEALYADDRAEFMARHREKAAAEERAKIVAWLRSRDQLEDCYSELQDDWLSNRIEAREHETFTYPDNV